MSSLLMHLLLVASSVTARDMLSGTAVKIQASPESVAENGAGGAWFGSNDCPEDNPDCDLYGDEVNLATTRKLRRRRHLQDDASSMPVCTPDEEACTSGSGECCEGSKCYGVWNTPEDKANKASLCRSTEKCFIENQICNPHNPEANDQPCCEGLTCTWHPDGDRCLPSA